MNSTLIRSAAALLIAAAAPAFASDNGAGAAPQPQPTDQAKKYCLSSSQLPTQVTTGTLIHEPPRQCLTR